MRSRIKFPVRTYGAYVGFPSPVYFRRTIYFVVAWQCNSAIWQLLASQFSFPQICKAFTVACYLPVAKFNSLKYGGCIQWDLLQKMKKFEGNGKLFKPISQAGWTRLQYVRNPLDILINGFILFLWTSHSLVLRWASTKIDFYHLKRHSIQLQGLYY